MLTPRQRDLLRFIADYMAASNGVAPSFVQMSEALGLRSKSGLHRTLCSLEERGFIRRLPYRARALEIVRSLPADENAALDRAASDREGVTLDELRALVERLRRRDGATATCAALVGLAHDCLKAAP